MTRERGRGGRTYSQGEMESLVRFAAFVMLALVAASFLAGLLLGKLLG